MDQEDVEAVGYGFETYGQEGASLLGGGDEPVVAAAPHAAVIADAPAAPLALYRRYRPDTFAQVIGQEHVTDPLQRALTNNRVNHAYLFSGPRGCGKTTSARILARCLNCEQGPTPTPCGVCQSCRDLARGGPGSIDVIEIDAASHGGVDDARDLRERAFFAPVHSRYKIYIVDEAHMVTTAGFNALLKLVEEPPPHVKFVFATTEPEKVIGTIRSRTHHYPFRLVPPRTLQTYLAELCEAEGIAVEPTVLPLVVRAGAGSVRDSLSVLDQLLGGAAASGVSYAQAAALLGYTPESLLDEIVDAFAAGDSAGVFACIDKVMEVGQDPRRFGEDLLRRLRDLVIVSAVPDAIASGLVDVAGDQAERLLAQAGALGSGELTRAAEVIATGLTEMRGTTAPRLYLELMCARVLLPGADVDERGFHARLDRIERRLAGLSVDPATDSVPQVAVSATPSPESRGELRSPAPSAAVGQPQTSDASAPVDARSASSVSPGQSQAPEPGRGVGAPSAPAGRPAGAPPPPANPAAPPVAAPIQPPGAAQPTASAPYSAAGQPAAGPPAPPPGAAQPTGFSSPAAATGQPGGAAPAAGVPGLRVADVRRIWPDILNEVKSRRRFSWILISQNAQVADVHDGVLTLALKNEGARDHFSKGGNEDVLREAIREVLRVDLRIQTMIDGSQPPAQRPGAQAVSSRPPAPPEQAAPTQSVPPVSPPIAHAGSSSDTPQSSPGAPGASASASGIGAPPSATTPQAAASGPATTPSAPTAAEPPASAQAPTSIARPPGSQQDTGHVARPPSSPAVPPGSVTAPGPGAPGVPVGERSAAALARDRIMPTRGFSPDEPPPEDEPPYDPYDDIEDVATETDPHQLLAKHLGAEQIAEEDGAGS